MGKKKNKEIKIIVNWSQTHADTGNWCKTSRLDYSAMTTFDVMKCSYKFINVTSGAELMTPLLFLLTSTPLLMSYSRRKKNCLNIKLLKRTQYRAVLIPKLVYLFKIFNFAYMEHIVITETVKTLFFFLTS